MSSDYTPTVGGLRQAYVEASGASMAQESYYAEQVAEFERGIARIKAEAMREALLSDESVERVADILEALDGDDYLTVARAALTVAIGGDDE